jgi:glycosyltransferase involved in cell wall biosynthesis
MNGNHRALFVTIVPSPYQRDLFRALAARGDIQLSVCYMEPASPDSPWPEVPLHSYERILPGFWVPFGGARWHVNWGFPDLSPFDFVILSSFTSLTGQWLMRSRLHGRRWLFWGERLRKQTSRWKARIQRLLIGPLQNATAIVGVGSAAQSDYQRRFPITRHFCIPYHCDLTEFFNVRRQDGDSSGITFLFCGQMIRRKGVDLLLTAFDRLIGKGLNAHLLLVGREADLPEFMKEVTPKTRERIRYEGFHAPCRLPEFFAKADVFVLPSRYDGWGVVVNQALGAGLPIICADSVGAGMDLVEENVNGLRFASGDAVELQRCMEQTALNPNTSRAWGKVSRQKAQTLSLAAGAEKWVRVFEELGEVAGKFV